MFGSNYPFRRQTNKFKIWRARNGPESKYSIFKVFTLYVMCAQFKILEEFFFFFRDGWIELVESPKKKYVSNLKVFFTKKVQDSIIFKYNETRPKILTFVNIFFKFEIYFFLMQLEGVYPIIAKKILLKLWIVVTLHTV